MPPDTGLDGEDMDRTREHLLKALGVRPIPTARHLQAAETLRQAVSGHATDPAASRLVIAVLDIGIASQIDGDSAATGWYLRAMRLLDRLRPEQLPSVEIERRLETVASLYFRRRDYAMAEAALNRALVIARESLGEGNRRTVVLRRRHERVARRLARNGVNCDARIHNVGGITCDGI
jgi:hypothetical protein